MKHIAVFASGAGSNAENIIRHFADRPETGRVEVIVCNREGAGVVERAAQLNIPVEIITADDIKSPNRMLAMLEGYAINMIVLAGFLMMIPPYLTQKYQGRMLNIHPSLLPAYGGKGMYGRRIHEAVIAAGETRSGITVHTVSDICDGGEIIFQTHLDIAPDDTPSTLEAKIHALERLHFPRIIEQYPIFGD